MGKKKTNHQVKKKRLGGDTNRPYSHMDSIHVKRSSASLFVKEIQYNITMQYHFISSELASTKKSDSA